MELRTYWRILIRRWWLVVIPVLVVLAYIGLTYSPPPTAHQVVMRFSAGTIPAGLSTDYDRYYPWLTSEYIANGLADVAETGAFAQAVAERLEDERNLSIPATTIQGAIVTDNAQSILVVYLTWADAEQAQAVGEAIALELTTSGATYLPQLEGLDPALRQLDEPAPIPLPPGLRAQLLGPSIRVGLALVAGIGLALLWNYLDPTIHQAEEVEELGLDVVAKIPRR
jgi:capsular polysaccharide biosynthesis protein